jgi:heme A synthase
MTIRINNYYYLLAGALAILFAATHAWNGQAVVLPELDMETVSLDTRIMFTYVWHIITAENLVFGMVFLAMSAHSALSRVRLAAWIVVSILLVRLMVILGTTAVLDASALTSTLMDSIAIIMYIALIILGIRRKNRLT